MKTKCAVIGVGHLGRIHAKLLKQIENAELVAVVDSNEFARETIATEHDAEHFAGYDEVLGKIDAAVVATPTISHYNIVKELLENDVHVLVEKPMTSTSLQAYELAAIAGRRGLTLQVGQVERFNPSFATVRNSIKSGELKVPRYIEATRTSSYTFRSTDVGVVLDLMIHDVDLVMSLVDSPIKDVKAIGIPVFGGHEDIAQVRLEFVNGTVANLTASRASYEAKRELKILSEDVFYNLDLSKGEGQSLKPSNEIKRNTHGFATLNNIEKEKAKEEIFTRYLPVSELEITPQNAILEEQKDFVHCIQNETEPVVSALDGAKNVEVCEKILDKIAGHSWQGLSVPGSKPETKVA